MTPDIAPFPAEALEANRKGLLSDAQRQTLTPARGRALGHDLYVAAFCLVVAVVIWRAKVTAGNEWARPVVAAGALVVAAVLVLRPAGPATRRMRRDLRAGRVESVEGAIARSMDANWGALPQYRHHYLEVAGQMLHVGRRGYEAAPQAGIVRVYFLPESRRVVNLERLPDRPLARELLESPAGVLKALGTAVGLHGRTAAADARADLSALAHALAPEQGPAVPPPPDAERDPRRLAQAILGSWHSGAIQLSFASDGSVAVKGLLGPERRARWSVDAAGRLRSDAMGADEAADAWVAGDTLTISADGNALVFHRTSAA